MDTGEWLKSLGLEQYDTAFRENAVGPELLPMLTADDLKDLGVSLVGHRRLLLEAIASLRLNGMPTLPSSPISFLSSIEPIRSLNVPGLAAERRPLSVMFCDLADSTALSSQLDPEDLHEVIRAYQARVAATIQPFNGFIARYVGDGVLIYFGWPRAHETDAERAVRAGLAVAAAVGGTPLVGKALHVRIGIATGLVIVGEQIGLGDARQKMVTGEAPNVAARLQGLAGPNQVLIDSATRRQIGSLFDCRELGTVELRGLPRPVPIWQVMAENRTLGQFEALRSGLTPLIGREEETDLLLRRWMQAKTGKGRVVLISAEPGVGKSRLAEALAERIAPEAYIRMRYFCSPHHQDSALYPVIAQMERAADFTHGDEPATRLGKLQTLLAATEPPSEDVALITELHGLPSASPALLLDITPQRRKEKAFEALLRQVEGLARQKPVLMVFDDIHWIDPSTCKLLDYTIERVSNWPVLLLALFRPEFQPPWMGQPQVTTLTLARLEQRDTTAMVASVARTVGNAVLPPEIVAEIAERTDGIPLFVEELTRAVLEAGTQQAPTPLSMASQAESSVPATLHASLMARLDRLGQNAKEIAQAGAAIGREFDYRLLLAVTELPEPQLREALALLTAANLVFARGAPPEASYIFKHALVQDAAYGSLLRSRRQALHRRIAVVLQECFPDIAQMQPALLAQHYQKGGLAKQALVYWLKAGQQGVTRSAMAEAVAQLRKGLEVLAELPDDPWRQQQELDLQCALGSALTATAGLSAMERLETVTRALALAEQLDRSEYLAPLIVRQWAFHLARCEHKLALQLAEQFDVNRKVRNNAAAQFLAYFLKGTTQLFMGRFVPARAVLEQCVELANPANRKVASAVISFDPYPWTLTFIALALAYLGHIDQARSRMDKAVTEARRLEHAYTLTNVLTHAAWLDCLTGAPMANLEELSALTAEHGYPHYMGWALALRGREAVLCGRAQDGVVLIKQGIEQFHTIGSSSAMPLLLMWLGEAHAKIGQHDQESACFLQATQFFEGTDERIAEAELYCVSGYLLAERGEWFAAEQKYQRAIAVAERQSAKFLQLRASTGLARLWHEQGKRAEARDLLVPIYDWFTEGFDVPDLTAARMLLDAMW